MCDDISKESKQKDGSTNVTEIRKPVQELTRRSYLMSKVHKFCDFLERTKISIECKDVKANVAKFRNFNTIIALSHKYGTEFDVNPDVTLQHFIEPYGFICSHFSENEWKTIKTYVQLIFMFSREMILNPMIENKSL